MGLDNREDINRYYKLINELVDDYTNKWKIRPSNLKKYLKPGSDRFNRFLERNKLKEISGSDRILKDIIEDRSYMEKDGVLTFESYNLFDSIDFKIHSMKSCLYKGIEKSTSKMEKILADVFDTNLSDIDIVDSDKHIFKVSNWDEKDVKVIIYSLEEIDVIGENIIDHLFDELSKKEVEISKDIIIKLSDIIDKELYLKKIKVIVDKKFIVDNISNLTGFEFYKESNSHLIWFM